MSIPDPLVLGTRGSELALRQANVVRSKLEAAGHRVDLQTISTRGDEATDTPISEIGDEAVFTKELDRALLQEEVDLAVHSLKDIPSTVPGGLALAAIGERADARDAFVAHPSFEGDLTDLPEGATVATASLRRTAQLLTWRSDLDVVPVRGNVDTRIEKLKKDRPAGRSWTGMVLAVAGLVRLGLSVHIRNRIDPDVMIPAVGQGALGIACREDHAELRALLRDELHHEPTGHAATAERAFLHEVGGGCQVPLGAWARLEDETLVLDACIAALDGGEYYRDQRRCAPEKGADTGRGLAQDLLAAGGDQILDEVLGDRRGDPSGAPFRP
ncbi:MAG: hydroxymethylbilane synthase [Salinibacter sp.]